MTQLLDSKRYFWTLTWIPGYNVKKSLLITYKDKEFGTLEVLVILII